MGSMRQLASMIRHVHQAQAIGIAEHSAEETLILTPVETNIVHSRPEPESAGEAGGPALQQS